MTSEEQIAVVDEPVETTIDGVLSESGEQTVDVLAEGNITGTSNYNRLKNKPQINGVELIGDKTFEELGAEGLTNIEIETIINSIV